MAKLLGEMNETDRVAYVLDKVLGDEYSELTLDFLVQLVLDFDIFHEIEMALKKQPSKFTDEVNAALSYTPDPFATYDNV